MSGNLRRRLAWSLIWVTGAAAAGPENSLGAEQQLTAMAQPSQDCGSGGASGKLTFEEALDRALCVNPSTREAWAAVKQQAAALGVSRAAFLPTLTASLQRNLSTDTTVLADHPELSSAAKRFASSQSLQLNWTLFDFGKRSADLRASEAELAAARAGHQATLLDVYANTVKEYLGAEAALSAANTDKEIEATAKLSYEAALGRAERGVAPISDALQAQTALADATLQKEHSQGQLHIALSGLAIHLELDPAVSLELPPEMPEIARGDIPETPEEMARQALANHPNVVQAEAQLDAAAAAAASTRAEGLPTVGLSGSASHNSTPLAASLGQPLLPASAREKSIALTVNIPLFEGFGRSYRVDQAEYRREAQRAHLDTVRQQVAAELWAAYYTLQEAHRSHELGLSLLSSAKAAYQAASERYRAGVGDVLELLTAQTSLATARQRVRKALVDWRSADFVLVTKLGVLPSVH